MKNTHLEAAQMLREAREYIERVGWTKNKEKDHVTGAVCLHRALKDVDGVKHGKAVDDEARRILILHTPKRESIISFNDAAGTVKDDVVTLLKACEQMERELAE